MPLEEKYLDLISSFLPNLFGEEEKKRFSALFDRVVATNQEINITSLVSPIDVTLKHILDSLTLFMNPNFTSDAKSGKRICDIGCGGGFPGLPVASVCTSAPITMIDSTEKKIKALANNATLLGLENVSPVWGRGEELAGKAGKYRGKFDLCISRAVAALPVLTELCLPFVRVGGTFYAMKGMKAFEELESAKKAIPMLGGALKEVQEIRLNADSVDFSLFSDEEKRKIEDFVSSGRYLVIIEKKKQTLPIYPRKWSQMTKKSL